MNAKEKLMVAAVECLRRHGHVRSTVKVIAEQAGVNQGLVHHYFGSKEKLLAQALEYMVNKVTVETCIRASAEEKRVYLPPIFANPDLMKVMLEFIALAVEMPEVREGLKGMIASRHEILRNIFGKDDPLAPLIFLGGMFGLAMQFRADPTLPVKEAANKLLGLVLTDLDPVRFPAGTEWEIS